MESESQQSRWQHLDQVEPGRCLSRSRREVIFKGRKQVSAHFLLTREGGKVWVPSPGSGPGALGKGHQKSALDFPVLLTTPLMGRWEIEG